MQIGHLDVLKVLLEAKANPNARDTRGNTCLHYAAHLKRIDICGQLILGGANTGIIFFFPSLFFQSIFIASFCYCFVFICLFCLFVWWFVCLFVFVI